MRELDPVARFRDGYSRARQSEAFDAARAALATADLRGRRSPRLEPLERFVRRRLQIVAHRNARKTHEMAEIPAAAPSFHRDDTGAQNGIGGTVEPLPATESHAYFGAQPRGRQLAAWASHQRSARRDRAELVPRVRTRTRRFEGRAVPRSDLWAGLLRVPERIEFWHDGSDRLHDQVLYTRTEHGWATRLLSP